MAKSVNPDQTTLSSCLHCWLLSVGTNIKGKFVFCNKKKKCRGDEGAVA